MRTRRCRSAVSCSISPGPAQPAGEPCALWHAYDARPALAMGEPRNHARKDLELHRHRRLLAEPCRRAEQPLVRSRDGEPRGGRLQPAGCAPEARGRLPELQLGGRHPAPGATGKLAGIPQCSDAQIAAAQARNQPGEGALESASPSCPAASKVGTVTVGAGAGPSPFYVTGSAYLAGPYKGAPFSGVFITPAIAGPFDLGVVVVRAGLYIDPATAQVTTRSDTLPTILQGIPLDIRSIIVDVDRPGFTLNPTNCTPMTASGEELSTQGQTARLSARFQVGNCAALPFHPKLRAGAAGKASKANGTTFTVNVTSAGLGQASIAKVALTLPKALPTRLTTIQKACLEATFNANPATCPEGSVIGMAKIHTPLLQEPARAARRTSYRTGTRPSRTSSSCCREKASRSCSTARPTSKRGSPTRISNPSQTRRSRV